MNYNMNLDVIHSPFDEFLLLSLRIADLYPYEYAHATGRNFIFTYNNSTGHEIIATYDVHMLCSVYRAYSIHSAVQLAMLSINSDLFCLCFIVIHALIVQTIIILQEGDTTGQSFRYRLWRKQE